MIRSKFYAYPFFTFTFKNQAHSIAFYTQFIHHFSFIKYEIWSASFCRKKHFLQISFPDGLSFERIEQLKSLEKQCIPPKFIH